jgi:butyrate kinase
MAFRILSVYPLMSTTKIGFFVDGDEVVRREIRHDMSELSGFRYQAGQWSHRLRALEELLSELNLSPEESPADAVIGLAWLPENAPCGVYEAKGFLCDDLVERADLGALLADALALPRGAAAYVVSPISSEEIPPESRLSGLPELPFGRAFHALSLRDAVYRASDDLGSAFEDLSVIAARLGRSFSICSYLGGRVMDLSVSNERGPFSPARTGAVPSAGIVRMAFSGLWSKNALLDRVRDSGGMASYSGTTNLQDVSRQSAAGDVFANLVIRSMAYQTSQEISAQATVLSGRVDAIVLTGGCARDEAFIEAVKEGVSWITDKILVYPGVDGLRIMADSALRVLRGKETVRTCSGVPG